MRRRVSRILATLRRWLRRPSPPRAPAWRWVRDESGAPLVGVRDLTEGERTEWLTRERERLAPRRAWLRPRP